MKIARTSCLLLLTGLPLTWSLAAAGGQDGKETPGGETVRSVTASELLPLRPSKKRFEIVNGDGMGQVTHLVLAASEDESREWSIELEGYNTLYLQELEGGGVSITRLHVVGEEEEHTLRFEPPILLLPNEIVPDRDWKQTGRAYVIAPDSGEVEHEGSYEHRVAPITQERLPTETGYLEGFSVLVEHDIELEAMASLHLRIDAGFVPERGLVHRAMRFTVDKPAWFGSTIRRTAVLTNKPVSGDDD